MEQRGFGRRVKEDVRDRQYPMRALLRPTSYPTARYYGTGRYLPLDQGHTGTCCAFMGVAFLMMAPMMSLHVPHPFHLYRAIIAEDEFEDNDHEVHAEDEDLQYGTTVRATVQELRRRGHIKSFVWAGNAEEMAAWLLTGKGPLMVGTDWHWSMSDPHPRTGVVELSGGIAGGHAWNVIGYNRVTKMFRGMCHWGKGFAKQGRFWVRHADMNTLIVARDGEACAAVEQRVLPIT